jgi:hypothetical protein
MAALNNLISNTAQQTTTLPSWFDTAQQNVATQAGNAFNAAPTPQNTVGQQAVNALSGPTNAFTQAGGTLQSIASGAANPWLTSASGQVTPNTQTALGGLFQAQNQQLNQLLPNAMAPAEAGAIGSGNFGSLRGQTAVDKAKADAFANLNTQQFQAALQNQATGVNAASSAGNVGQQNINNLLTTGQYQQAAPFTNASNYGKVLGGLTAPTTVNNQTQLSPLNQVAGLVQALGGASGTAGILGALGIKNGLQGLISKIPSLSGIFSGSGSGMTIGPNGLPMPGTFPLEGGGTIVVNPDGSRVITNADGTVSNFDKDGNPSAPVLEPIPITGLPPTTDPVINPDNPEPIPMYDPVIPDQPE